MPSAVLLEGQAQRLSRIPTAMYAPSQDRISSSGARRHEALHGSPQPQRMPTFMNRPLSRHGPGRMASVPIPPSSNSRSRARMLATEERGSTKLRNRPRWQAFGEGIVTTPSPTALVEYLPCLRLLKLLFTPVLEWTLHPTTVVPSARVSASIPPLLRLPRKEHESYAYQPGLPLCDWNFEPEGGIPTILSRQ